MADSLIIIPTYNERENIEKIIETVFSLPKVFHILVVDDGSPDGTANIVKQLHKNWTERLFLLERSGKQGLGTAYIAGFKWGLQHHYQYFFEMDADFSHNPYDLPRLYEAFGHVPADVVVGSRYVKGGRLANWPLDRILLSYGASLYVRLITWMPVKDPTAGFVGYRRNVLETIDLDKIRFVGYAFQIEMKYAARLLGFKIAEVPIVFTDRLEGNSKMSRGIVREAIWGVLQMRWNSFFDSYALEFTD
ncbi:MAG TPA: polyprenol monophosphomannose synthase [Saprospiraceae bacterium]|nr:polyprenol monophosphomannose synthase [Saprospiraceae bacterium]HMP13023.1 polyprenol monophosphomannose synthase [Saprospiraceae bacterium]